MMVWPELDGQTAGCCCGSSMGVRVTSWLLLLLLICADQNGA
jgi:hypothetical protein